MKKEEVEDERRKVSTKGENVRRGEVMKERISFG